MAADRRFADRTEAGRILSGLLEQYRQRPDVVVLGLPRGGVPVAAEVARALDAPLDVFVVRKLGAPGFEELAMGAIASGGVQVLNHEVIARLEVTEDAIAAVATREGRELWRRETAYRGDRPPAEITGRAVLLVDDGLATGSTMRAAVAATRARNPASVVVAAPTAPQATVASLRSEADDVIVATTPEPFTAVGHSYVDFSQTSDDEVRRLIRAAQPPTEP